MSDEVENGGIEQTTDKPGWQRGFWCLMITQFQGAFSDSVLKQLVILLLLTMRLPNEETLVAWASGLFALPFILFTMLGGWLADRYSKRTVMSWVKVAEVAIMLFATWGLVSQRIPLQMASICMMGIHSSIFGPSKYGILPELLPEKRLSWGNGLLEAFTFLSIILGMLLAGYLAETFARNQLYSGYVLIGLALCGLTASRGITRVPAADPGKRFAPNFVAEFWRQMMDMKPHRDLWRANWGNAAFFFVAALVQMNLVLYANEIFHFGPKSSAGLLAALCLGIGGGSALAGYISRGRIEYGLIAPGAVLMAVSGATLGWPGISHGLFTVALTALGIGGGLFIVPIAAVLQHEPPPEKKGTVQGAAGLLSWIAIALASAAQWFLSSPLGWKPPHVFLFCSGAAAIAGIFVARSRPRAVPGMIARWRGMRS